MVDKIHVANREFSYRGVTEAEADQESVRCPKFEPDRTEAVRGSQELPTEPT